jgi:hypothetical protein
MWISDDSVICGGCPSEAEQWIAGGEEGNPGCVNNHTLHEGDVRWQGMHATPCHLCALLGNMVKVTARTCLHTKSTRRNRLGSTGFAM